MKRILITSIVLLLALSSCSLLDTPQEENAEQTITFKLEPMVRANDYLTGPAQIEVEYFINEYNEGRLSREHYLRIMGVVETATVLHTGVMEGIIVQTPYSEMVIKKLLEFTVKIIEAVL